MELNELIPLTFFPHYTPENRVRMLVTQYHTLKDQNAGLRSSVQRRVKIIRLVAQRPDQGLEVQALRERVREQTAEIAALKVSRGKLRDHADEDGKAYIRERATRQELELKNTELEKKLERVKSAWRAGAGFGLVQVCEELCLDE